MPNGESVACPDALKGAEDTYRELQKCHDAVESLDIDVALGAFSAELSCAGLLFGTIPVTLLLTAPSCLVSLLAATRSSLLRDDKRLECRLQSIDYRLARINYLLCLGDHKIDE
jgi:hypothetical protein